MKKLSKILSLVLVFILLFSTTALMSCQKPTLEGAVEESNVESGYIIKTEIKDGSIWVTYSNDPQNPVNIGSFGSNGGTGSENSLTFMPLANGSYGVSAGNARYLEEITIPATYNGKAVTTIIENAFSGATHLKKITIPSSIISVGDNAFYNCGNLEYNEKNNGLYLGNAENPYLILVKAKDATITRCDVEPTAIAICDNAFYGCTELSVLNIPNSVKNIGSYAFSGCTAIDVINIPDGCTYIGTETFLNCVNLRKINIPASVSNIGSSAFANCDSLSEVTFASNSTLVGFANKTFSGCKSLKSITIPKTVTYIGDNKASVNTDGVFFNCSSLEKVTFENGSVLKQIGNHAFNKCTKLTAISLPETINYIGISAFQGSGLKNIKLPETVVTINENTFYNCKSLKTVTLGSKVTKIGVQAFAACSVLDNVVIPATVKFINPGAFDDKCASLTSVEFKDPKGWYVNTAKPTAIDEASLKDPSTAVTTLLNYSDIGIGKP